MSRGRCAGNAASVQEMEVEMTDLKCPYCDFKVIRYIPDDIAAEELRMMKECPCGKVMETVQETELRMKKRGIKKKSFYTMIRRQGTNKALKKEGIEFDKCGVNLYAYQSEKDYPMCFIIDPETGLSLETVYHPLDVVYRHISYIRVDELKHKREYQKGTYYAELKKAFQEAERIEIWEEKS